MEYEKIKRLMDDMDNSNLSSIEIDFPDGMKISIKKEQKQIVRQVETISAIDTVSNDNNANQVEENKIKNYDNSKVIKSPMVGTFYLKPSPISEPYVEVGKTVKKGDTVCIIEAMKLMNEIESEFDGIIKEILVNDGEPVEFGKPLFVVE